MKSEQITVNKLIAEEGMILTDGETYGKVVFLGKNRKASDFHEITVEKYEEIKAKKLETEVTE